MSNRNRKKAEIKTTLYELNKLNMKQISPVDKEWLKTRIEEISNEIIDSSASYYMLLNRERYDITVFNFEIENNIPFKREHLSQDLFETLNNRGDVLDLTPRGDGSYEIWIRDFETKENFVYYLFDYSYGVIEI